jgi:DNA-binding response OmpR family regulator
MCAMYSGLPPRILVIDDDIDLLMLLERTLDQSGYAVETAASIPQGEEILQAFWPQLVLLDINVKGEDGRQLCWKIKNQMPELQSTKVIMMSGLDVSKTRAALFGADDVIAKPMTSDYLLQRVDAFCSTLSTRSSINRS